MLLILTSVCWCRCFRGTSNKPGVCEPKRGRSNRLYCGGRRVGKRIAELRQGTDLDLPGALCRQTESPADLATLRGIAAESVEASASRGWNWNHHRVSHSISEKRE